MTQKRVFFATDGSGTSQAAEAVAGEMASCLATCFDGCELVVGTVIPPDRALRLNVPYRGTVPRGPLIHMPTEEMEQEAKEVVAEASGRIKAAFPNEKVTIRAVILRDASPAMGILEFLAKEECGYIVMGNRGHGRVGSLMLGSVSTEVLHGASCPVVIVRE
ncbi:MAG: universal stress protein [Gaiellales bacterium]|nr:universal stress protein [Gaiellales bacterium]